MRFVLARDSDAVFPTPARHGAFALNAVNAVARVDPLGVLFVSRRLTGALTSAHHEAAGVHPLLGDRSAYQGTTRALSSAACEFAPLNQNQWLFRCRWRCFYVRCRRPYTHPSDDKPWLRGHVSSARRLRSNQIALPVLCVCSYLPVWLRPVRLKLVQSRMYVCRYSVCMYNHLSLSRVQPTALRLCA